METPKEYHYTYYSYEEWGRGYFGSRTCRCLPEKDVRYFGSFRDKTFKPTQKIILKDDYDTREEALVDEIILQEYYEVVENPHFANKAYQTSTKFYVPKQKRIENGRIGGNIGGKNGGMKTKELGLGVHALTPEQRKENSKKGGNKCKELGVGVCGRTKEKRIEDSRKAGSIGGKRNVELGTGLFSMTDEELSEAGKKGGKIGGKKGGKKTKELGVGFFSMTEEEKQKARSKGGKISGNRNKELGIGMYAITPEQKSQTSKKTAKEINSQKWMCLETGHISTPGSLTKYQRNRGIDTSKRKRIE